MTHYGEVARIIALWVVILGLIAACALIASFAIEDGWADAPECPPCPTCPHDRDAHGAFGCKVTFCGCERSWIGGGWP